MPEGLSVPITKGVCYQIQFSDGTPTQDFVYNHLAMMIKVVDASGTRDISYSIYDELDSESTVGLTNYILIFERDNYGCEAGYSLKYGNITVQQSEWQYDGYGRFSSVSLNQLPALFTYGYNTNYGLLETII